VEAQARADSRHGRGGLAVLERPTTVEQLVHEALNDVIDPCSAGRGVPAGLQDMGMVDGVGFAPATDGRSVVQINLRLTSPGCTFQLYFERELHERLDRLPEVERLDIVWSKRFDWDDRDMSPALKQRLRRKRVSMLEAGDTQ